MKIALIGAGSVVFTKNLLGDILSFPELDHCMISLHDIDPIRLETARLMAAATAQRLNVSPQIEAHLDRREALRNAKYVINMIQVGGHAATLIDFEIPRKYGLKQTIADTHGVGGIFRALRTIPVMLNIARDMETVCPGAILLNYTNPMAMLCWAVFESSAIPIVGLCHSVQHTTAQMSSYAGIPYEEVTYLGGGINHVAWILRFEHHGQDAYPLLRNALEEGRIPKTDRVRAELFRSLGYYVTESSEHNAEYSSLFIPHDGEIERLNIPINEYIRRSEENLKEFQQIRAALLQGESFPVERSAEYASLIIHSMETGQPRVIYGNVRNDGLIDNLPEGCCVEVPCLVDQNGVQPTRLGALPPQLAGLSRQHVAVQELAVRAVLDSNHDHIFHAVMHDPLAAATMPLPRLRDMTDELIAAHGTALPEALRLAKVSS
ncbi:MAG TPA: alpha-glucosidase/alpha-galactosidase [Aggregatilineales bacterium]|nr:alpha-glucosidase/alpha-galactosidase [Aggregatilineales bacterium]